MRAISVPQPWAGAAVFGITEVLNLGFRTRYRGPLLIHAGGYDRRINRDPAAKAQLNHAGLSRVYNAFVGLVELVDCTPAEDCQLRFAIGPNVWIVSEPAAFDEPVGWPKFKGLDEIDDAAVLEAATAIEPAAWRKKRERERLQNLSAEDVHPRRPGGWTGD